MNLTVSPDELKVLPPKDPSLGLAILGCGEIANSAHLPAYRALGLNVAACYDVNREAARSTADRFNIPKVYDTLQELLADADVAVVDIAFHMAGRLEALREACDSGKHVLIQKPISHSLAEAEEMVSIAEQAGCKMQVNHQARWAPVFVLAKKWLERGAIARLNFLRLEMRGWQDDPDTWYVKQENMTLVDHGIHYFDLLRHYAGRDACSVAAMHASVPGQVHRSPVIYSAIIDFGDGLLASHSFNNKVETNDPWGLRITLDGTQGSIVCDLTTARLLRKDDEERVVTPEGMWFPDAFGGPMSDLLDAIVEDREPVCSARSNLGTLKLVLGALESAQSNRFVRLAAHES